MGSHVKNTPLPSEQEAVNDLRKCLYHGKEYRSNYQALINVLRGNVVPFKYVRSISSRICLCRTSGNYLDEVIPKDTEEIKRLKDKVFSIISEVYSSSEGQSTNTQENIFILKWHKVLDKINENRSITRFAFLLLQCAEGIYDFMEPPKPPPEPSGPAKPKLLTETIILPLRTEYVPFFIGKKGSNLRNLVKPITELDLKVNIVRKKGVYTETTECVVNTRSPEVLRAVKELLILAAGQTQKSRILADEKTVKHFKRKLVNATQRRERLADNIHDSTNQKFGVASMIKEERRDMFVKKHSSQQYDNGKSNARPKPPAVLEEGSRCLNCLTPFTHNKLKNNSCKYHPGFIAEREKWVKTFKYASKNGSIEVVTSGKKSVIVSEKKWSCCGEVAENTLTIDDQEKSHLDTGCYTGNHNFRPTKNVNVTKKNMSKNWKGKIKPHASSGRGMYSQQISLTAEEEEEDLDMESEYLAPKVACLADFIQQKM